MYEIRLTVEGMMCCMCEAHVQDAIRNQAKVKKVKANHKDNSVVITAKEVLSEADLHKILDPTGYRITAYQCKEA